MATNEGVRRQGGGPKTGAGDLGPKAVVSGGKSPEAFGPNGGSAMTPRGRGPQCNARPMGRAGTTPIGRVAMDAAFNVDTMGLISPGGAMGLGSKGRIELALIMGTREARVGLDPDARMAKAMRTEGVAADGHVSISLSTIGAIRPREGETLGRGPKMRCRG